MWKEMFHFPNDPTQKVVKKNIPEKVKETDSSVSTVPEVNIPEPAPAPVVVPAPVEKKVTKSKVKKDEPVPIVPVQEVVVVPKEVVAVQEKTAVIESEVPPVVEAPPQEVPAPAPAPAPAATAAVVEATGCQYRLTRGPNAGELCGKKLKTDKYCTLHSK